MRWLRSRDLWSLPLPALQLGLPSSCAPPSTRARAGRRRDGSARGRRGSRAPAYGRRAQGPRTAATLGSPCASAAPAIAGAVLTAPGSGSAACFVPARAAANNARVFFCPSAGWRRQQWPARLGAPAPRRRRPVRGGASLALCARRPTPAAAPRVPRTRLVAPALGRACAKACPTPPAPLVAPHPARQRARSEKERPRRIAPRADICSFVAEADARLAGRESGCAGRECERAGGEGKGEGLQQSFIGFRFCPAFRIVSDALLWCAHRSGHRLSRAPGGEAGGHHRSERARACLLCRGGSARGAASGGRGDARARPRLEARSNPRPGPDDPRERTRNFDGRLCCARAGWWVGAARNAQRSDAARRPAALVSTLGGPPAPHAPRLAQRGAPCPPGTAPC